MVNNPLLITFGILILGIFTSALVLDKSPDTYRELDSVIWDIKDHNNRAPERINLTLPRECYSDIRNNNISLRTQITSNSNTWWYCRNQATNKYIQLRRSITCNGCAQIYEQELIYIIGNTTEPQGIPDQGSERARNTNFEGHPFFDRNYDTGIGCGQNICTYEYEYKKED